MGAQGSQGFIGPSGATGPKGETGASGTEGSLVCILIYYIDTDEIPGFFLLLKIISSSCAVKIPFSSFTCEDNGVAMVTNMISQFCYRIFLFFITISISLFYFSFFFLFSFPSFRE